MYYLYTPLFSNLLSLNYGRILNAYCTRMIAMNKGSECKYSYLLAILISTLEKFVRYANLSALIYTSNL